MFGQAINPIIRSDGSPKFAMACMLAGALTNVVGDPIAIFVCKGGVVGAAIATVLGQLVTAGMSVWYLCHTKILRLEPADFRLSGRILGAFLPNRIYYKLMQYERWFFILLMVLTVVGAFTWLLNFLGQYVVAGINATFVRLGQLLYSAIAGLF